MQRRFNSSLWLSVFLGLSSVAYGAGGVVESRDVKTVVGLIKYLYAGYDNGANERKSFFETVPWDLETGHLIDRVGQCEREEGEVIDMDWPSNSQDPQIKNLSVVYVGSPSPKHATVRATFQSYNARVAIDYDMYLYDVAPLRHWGVSNIRIHDDHGTNDLLKTLRQALGDECRKF